VGRDPIGFDGSKWCLYEYVGSNSTGHTDPTGLQAAPPPRPAGHGHFCGPTRAAICNGTGPAGNPAPFPINPHPIDSIDAACAEHDCCLADPINFVYELCGYTTCNKFLCEKAKNVDCNIEHPNNAALLLSCENMKLRIKFFICP